MSHNLNLAGLKGHYADAISEAVARWEPRYWPMFHAGARDKSEKGDSRHRLEWWAAVAAHMAVHMHDDSGRTALVHGAMCLAYQNAIAALGDAPAQGVLDLDLLGGEL